MKSRSGYILAAVSALVFLSVSAAHSSEIPVFEGFCTKMASKPVKLMDRLATYAQCTAWENESKDQLEKHWSWVSDDDLKHCLRYKGTMYEMESYVSLNGCLSGLVGLRCFSGELDCSRGTAQ
jgi:hypothetical protein